MFSGNAARQPRPCGGRGHRMSPLYPGRGQEPAQGHARLRSLPLVKLFNDKLSDLRREVQREAEGPLAKKVLKGTRWLLLKHPDNLDPKRNEKQRLKEALKLNEPLATAYYLKETAAVVEQRDLPSL